MKAVVWHGIGDIRLDEVPDPKVEQPTDAVVRVDVSGDGGRTLRQAQLEQHGDVLWSWTF